MTEENTTKAPAKADPVPAAAKAEQEKQTEIAKAGSDAPEPMAADKMTWKDMLEESSGWRMLAEEADLTFTDDMITGPVGMDNALAARVANAAEILLEGKVHRVVTSTQPSLRVVVEE